MALWFSLKKMMHEQASTLSMFFSSRIIYGNPVETPEPYSQVYTKWASLLS